MNMDESLLRGAAMALRRAKRLPPGMNKEETVGQCRDRCAALCVKLGLPDNAANGTRQQLIDAIANLHPERNPPSETH